MQVNDKRPATAETTAGKDNPTPRQLLQRVFGYHDFRLQQERIIDSLVRGRDVLALMPTGGGKSLCYQIPALLRSGAGVVVSPLIALMQDQVNALNQLGLRAAFLNSTLQPAAQREIEQQLLDGRIDLLYLAPERLLTEQLLSLLARARIALFAIDEAHCVSQWGHDFRKEYQRLSLLHQRFPDIPRIALTATADQRTRQEIIDQLELRQADQYVNSFDRPNIRYTVDYAANGRQQLWRFLQRNHPRHAGIVYCLSRRRVEQVAQWLSSQGRPALPYHAGLDSETRRRHQRRFLSEEGLVMVATIAFGMGIDKPDVRFVAHLNLPRSIEAYYQETGRAGRDGAPADAWMNYGLQDVITLRQLVQESDADSRFKQQAQHRLTTMLGFCELTSCRRRTLLGYFGESLSEPCGNCDNCLQPPPVRDAGDDARKALSCVYRTGQRFGVNYLTSVLRGVDDPRIQRNGHHRTSTYGIGKDLNTADWRSLFRQLMAQGYLDIDSGGHGALQLTEKCRPLLRGTQTFTLRQPPNNGTTRSRTSPEAVQPAEEDQPLFQALRTLRMQTARQQGVPPYVIFHDSTLHEMARRRPITTDSMAEINGVGERKLSRYGESFLDLIKSHAAGEPPGTGT